MGSGITRRTSPTTTSSRLEIALAHLNEFPDYYTRLQKMEAEAERYWSQREGESAS